MATNIEMPRLSDTMSEGTIAKWRKAVGEQVNKGDIIVEIETDKATMDLEAFHPGILGRILVNEGDTVAIGVPIAILVEPGEVVPAAAAPTPIAKPAEVPASATPATAPVAAAPAAAPLAADAPVAVALLAPAGRLRVSPLARSLAEQNGIDLRRLRGTGPSGRIIRVDVEAAVQSGAARLGAAGSLPAGIQVTSYPPLDGDEDVTMNTLQQTVVRRMLESKLAPEFFVTSEIDMTAAIAFRRDANASLPEGKGVSFNDLIVRAAALALKANPKVNASYADGKFRMHKQVNVGIAVAMPDGGLVVPVVKAADTYSLTDLAAKARDLIERARTKKLALADMEGSTISISNLGMFDVDQFTGIINQPNAAILAIGAIVKKPVVKGDQVVAGDRLRITMTCDHRVLYGADAAIFLRDVKRYLEQPLLLVL